MSETVPEMFANVTAKLEDLHAVAIEGQRADNAADMQAVLLSHLCLGVAALGASMRSLAKSVHGDTK